MNKLKYEKSHSSYYMDKLDEVLSWLSDKKLKAYCSRYSRYKKYIDDFYKPSSFSEKESKFTKLSVAFQECIEIVTVYESFMDENSKGFNNRLKQVVSGKDFYDESIKSDQARDILYELLVASYFKSKGYIINFESNTDVIAERNGDKVLIECKRIKSSNGLEENINKAGKQLKKAVGNSTYGIVFTDIYQCIFDKLRDYEYSSIVEMNYEYEKVVNDFYNNHTYLFDSLLEKHKDYSLGICFTAYRCLWLSNLQPQYFRKFSVYTPGSISDEMFKKTKSILG